MALKQAKIDISTEPPRNDNVPIYIHYRLTDETYVTGVFKDHTHLLENITAPPTSQMYWMSASGLSITEQHLHILYTYS